MPTIFRHIPPLACDFSGAASVLYSLPGLHLFYCPGTCTQPIAEWDELRSLQQSFLFYSMFGEVSAVMGADEEFLEQAELLSRHNDDAQFVSIISTPVPAIVGSDLAYMAAQLQARINKPVIVVNTAGFESYYTGVDGTLHVLAKAFLQRQLRNDHQINLLGYTPLSLGHERHLGEFKAVLEGCGLTVRGLPQTTDSIAAFGQLSAACLNVVLTHEGLGLARYMSKQFDIPYIAGLPVGIRGMNVMIEKIGSQTGRTIRFDGKILTAPANSAWKHAVVIGEPLFAASMAQCLVHDFGIGDAQAVSAQEQERKLRHCYKEKMIADVHYVPGEDNLQQALEVLQADIIFGDPMYRKFLNLEGRRYIDLPHIGLSGRKYAELPVAFIGAGGYQWIKQQLER